MPGQSRMKCQERGAGLLVLIVVLALGLVAGGCNRNSKRQASGVPFSTSTTSPKLSTFTFKEEGRQYFFTVGVNAARFHDKDRFVPFTVLLVNKTTQRLQLTRESFTLVDPASGSRYSLASIPEVRAQGKQTYDAQVSRTDLEHFGSKLDVYRRTPSNFFPYTGIVNDRIELHQFQFMFENLYFPHPEGQLLGKTFELHVNSSDLEQSLFVVFVVPEK